ncbi:hypothetical protein DH2020_005173 [Rehmannia glutinosa]|uniref:Protein kinase domain-containing protein n=1 Tax=Rehmannia glutinosa TaxID=99300 RepID=A0ABR0XRJ2_REHGL
MDAAAQLVYRGVDPLYRTSPLSSATSNGKGRNRRLFPTIKRNAVVRAIATEPRPSDTQQPKVINGSSKTKSYKPVNGASTVDESSEFLPLVYDPDTIAAYWGKRPRAVASRIVQLMSVAGGFLSRLAWDLIKNKIKENEVARAIELREIVTSLGPAYIKLGQALSIRPDILSPSAMIELQKLCDKVPSFPDDVAMALLEEELGQPWYNIYSELSSSPIAAASLGQVYKGRLKENGDLVAVKVQRPFVLETVTVDLFIIRKLGLFLRKFPQVVVPKTYLKYTARKVLTTQWIEGEKLSQSTESDVGELVNVGVICYLKQLLDTGFFHADPHPGNLIRTPDGKLAILDFGLVTKLTDDQKYGMIEAIAHLIHRDYAAIVKDFVKLGFIPEGVNLDPILPVLAKVFDQALEAIGVLEGIALVGNPEFAIVDEAYPYIAQIVKGIDAVTREQLVQIMAFLGVGNVTPVFSLVPTLGPIRTTALLPSITEEDKVILNNVQKIVEFLAAGSAASSNQGVNVPQVIQELLPVLPGLSAKVLPEVLSRLSSRVFARIIRDTLL